MKRFELKNRHGLKIVGVMETKTEIPKGTAVLQHGWGSNRNKDTIQAIKNGFLDGGFQTFNFDATHSSGESEGDFQRSTLATFTEDFEDVANWVQEQDWFVAPLAVSGHSKGGYAAIRYATDNPHKVDLVVPVAPVISGKLSFEAYEERDPVEFANWQKEGVLVNVDANGKTKVKNWSQMLERLQHDLIPKATNLTMPILFIVGSEDMHCPPKHVKQLFDAIPGNKKYLEIIPNTPHSLHKKEERDACISIIKNWLVTQ